jgi:hypothetical protein
MIKDLLLRSSPVTTSETGNFCAAITSLIRAIVSPVRTSSEIISSRVSTNINSRVHSTQT